MKTVRMKCSQCRTSVRRSTAGKALRAMRRHQTSKHVAWLSGRIKAGQHRSEVDNPSIQDMVQAIQKGSSRAAQAIAKQMTESRYQQVKQVMDAVQVMLPLKAAMAWESVEAAHDIYRKIKKVRR